MGGGQQRATCISRMRLALPSVRGSSRHATCHLMNLLICRCRFDRPYAPTRCLDALAKITSRERCAVVTLQRLAQRGSLAAPLRRPPPCSHIAVASADVGRKVLESDSLLGVLF